MALFDLVDLRTDRRKIFICTISLCHKFGDETVHTHSTIESAEKSMEWINRIGCGGGCCKLHYLVVIPRGHIRNIKNRAHYKGSGYLRWLITSEIVQ